MPILFNWSYALTVGTEPTEDNVKENKMSTTTKASKAQASSVSRLLTKKDFLNSKTYSGRGFHVYEVVTGWNGDSVQVFGNHEEMQETHARYMNEIADVLRVAGYFVRVGERTQEKVSYANGVRQSMDINANWLVVTLEDPRITDARNAVARAQAQLAQAEAALAELVGA